jgi:hypothetical protein
MVYEINKIKIEEGAKEIMKALVNNLEIIVNDKGKKPYGEGFVEAESRILTTYQLFNILGLNEDQELSEVYWKKYRELKNKFHNPMGIELVK